MRSAGRAAPALLPVLAVLASCLPEPQPELVARHEAERARWYVDASEDLMTDADIRAGHLEIARRFGPGEPPDTPGAAEHYRIRQIIAASSALYAADLGAQTEGASMELAAEYASIAQRWPDQEQLHFLARLREAATLQRIGHGRDALAAFRNVRALSREVDLTGLPWAEYLPVDLEVHVAMLALQVDPGPGTDAEIARARDRLLDAARESGEEIAARRMRRRAAELAILVGDVEGARESLVRLASDAPKPAERAELALLLGEVHQYMLDDSKTAEAHYRRAAEQGTLIGASADARLRLVELALERGTPKIGLRIVDEVLSLGARARLGRNEEALYWRSRCLLDMGRWTEAIPSLEEGAAGDPSSPFTLACAARLHVQRTTPENPLPERETALLLEVAADVPPEPPVEVPREWVTSVRRERARFAWNEGVERLREVARLTPDREQAKTARHLAGRILRERTILAQGTRDDAFDGRR